MERNLAKISQDEMDKVNVDLAAAGVAFKETVQYAGGR
ncbi:DNA polymerase III subunit theta [Klebsiella pneumoniae]|nr:DNA polymerase III subunit theta [Klebsiella pneumoniae]